MFRYTLRQMRASIRGLAAAGLAVGVATAFITAMLIGAGVAKDTAGNIIGERYAKADLVASIGSFWDGVTPSQEITTAVGEVPGVIDVFQPVGAWVMAQSGARSEWIQITSTNANPQLSGWPVTEGAEPTTTGQVSVAASMAGRLGLSIGDAVTISYEAWVPTTADTSLAGGTNSSNGPDGEEPAPSVSPDPLSQDGQDSSEPDAVEIGPFDEGEVIEQKVSLTVTGLFDDSLPNFGDRPGAQVAPPTMLELSGGLDDEAWLTSPGLLIAVEPGTDLSPNSAFRSNLTEAVAVAAEPVYIRNQACPSGVGVGEGRERVSSDGYTYCTAWVLTANEATQEVANSYLGDIDVLAAAGIIFGIVSLLVAGLVISNTFQVLIAARTKVLALLRAVGATKEQIRRTVLTEALVTGLVASLGGIVLGWLLTAIAMVVAARLYPDLPLPATPGLPWLAVAAGLGTGVPATVLASLMPARLATRVTPIEALRPQAAPLITRPGGRARFRWSVIFDVMGLSLIAAGIVLSNYDADDPTNPAPLLLLGSTTGVFGGALVAIGLILGSVFWLPKVVGWFAHLVGKAGGGSPISAANLVRNPRRTAATATALLIGTTLVSAMVVGGDAVSRSMDKAIGQAAPVDVTVGSGFNMGGLMDSEEVELNQAELEARRIPEQLTNQLLQIEGVETSATISSILVVIPDDQNGQQHYTLNLVDKEAFSQTIDLPDLADRIEPGVILVDRYTDHMIAGGTWGSWLESLDELTDVTGTERTFKLLDGTEGEVKFRYVPELDDTEFGLLTDAQTVTALGGEATPVDLWLRLERGADAVAVQQDILDHVTETTSADDAWIFPVDGQAVARAETRRAVDMILMVGLALLAVSIIVALIGVSNTLSLSVIERTQEIALLRALGLTRGQARWMLATEGTVIAGLAGLVGVVLGTGFAHIIQGVLLAPLVGFVFAFPVWRVLALLALAIVTGLLASVLPGRRAARIAPAEALAST
ncbi:MAG: FtsX-like permease family protein [Bifidobacteriaceae bacterium]|jgi:putative ABC transport system permease protein|nr:FtsX-like permease family protein [Bifidobacteriaceae bacterium]